MDCSLPGTSVHGILQAMILGRAAISYFRDLPNPGVKPRSPALQADALPSELLGKPFTSMWYLALIFKTCASSPRWLLGNLLTLIHLQLRSKLSFLLLLVLASALSDPLKKSLQLTELTVFPLAYAGLVCLCAIPPPLAPWWPSRRCTLNLRHIIHLVPRSGYPNHSPCYF